MAGYMHTGGPNIGEMQAVHRHTNIWRTTVFVLNKWNCYDWHCGTQVHKILLDIHMHLGAEVSGFAWECSVLITSISDVQILGTCTQYDHTRVCYFL